MNTDPEIYALELLSFYCTETRDFDVDGWFDLGKKCAGICVNCLIGGEKPNTYFFAVRTALDKIYCKDLLQWEKFLKK